MSKTHRLVKNGILTPRTEVTGIITIATGGSVSRRRQRNHGEDKNGYAADNHGPTRG
jgi:hypothetical protein